MTLLGRVEAVKALYESLNPILGQHRDQLREDQYYRLAELESEILNTVPYDVLAAAIGPSHELMSVLEKTEHRMQLALADGNMQTLTVNHRTVQDVIEEMKRVVA